MIEIAQKLTSVNWRMVLNWTSVSFQVIRRNIQRVQPELFNSHTFPDIEILTAPFFITKLKCCFKYITMKWVFVLGTFVITKLNVNVRVEYQICSIITFTNRESGYKKSTDQSHLENVRKQRGTPPCIKRTTYNQRWKYNFIWTLTARNFLIFSSRIAWCLNVSDIFSFWWFPGNVKYVYIVVNSKL